MIPTPVAHLARLVLWHMGSRDKIDGRVTPARIAYLSSNKKPEERAQPSSGPTHKEISRGHQTI